MHQPRTYLLGYESGGLRRPPASCGPGPCGGDAIPVLAPLIVPGMELAEEFRNSTGTGRNLQLRVWDGVPTVLGGGMR